MPNSNCLDGFQCPQCGAYEPFDIEIIKTERIFDDGSENIASDINWDETSACSCLCGYHGKIKHFKQ